MATSTPPVGSFPSPYEIETPPGCEGWEEMYPYYALFDERRREQDEQRFWFWNSMHFPLPMPAFDLACVDVPYMGIGDWQNRVFAVPPVMGIDYRVVNGYIYISGNPVTDPAKIAERAEFFQKRAGHYFANWDELYAKWKQKMEALIAELTAIRVPELGEYEPDEVVFGNDRNTGYVEVLDAYGRLLRCGELAWQHHSEFLLLGYGTYATFSDFCKSVLPDIPDQHIAQMVAGIDVLLFVPGRRAQAPRASRHRERRGLGVRRGALARGDRRRACAERRRQGVARGAREGEGPVVQHGDRRRALPLLRELARRPEHPVRVAHRVRAGNHGRRGDRAADRGDRSASVTGSPRSTARCSTRRRARASTSCSGSRAWSSPTSRSTSSSATTGS